MGEFIVGLKRTNMCSELDLPDVGKDVTVMGWVSRRRDLGGVIFIDLRDRSGILQVVFNSEKNQELFDKASTLRNEFVIAVSGQVVKRSEDTINPKIKTGEIEVFASELRILSKAQTPPFYIEEESNVNELVRLKYRYLDLRRPDMQKNLILRHRVCKIARDYYDENGFLEIEIPDVKVKIISE